MIDNELAQPSGLLTGLEIGNSLREFSLTPTEHRNDTFQRQSIFSTKLQLSCRLKHVILTEIITIYLSQQFQLLFILEALADSNL